MQQLRHQFSTCKDARLGMRTWRFTRANTEPPFSAASMSPDANGDWPEDVRLAYESRRARLAAFGSSSSAGVPFDAIVS